MNLRTESCKWYKIGTYNPDNERIRCRNPDVPERAPVTTVCDGCVFHETSYRSRHPNGEDIQIGANGMLEFDLLSPSGMVMNPLEPERDLLKKRKIGEVVQLESIIDLTRSQHASSRNTKRNSSD